MTEGRFQACLLLGSNIEAEKNLPRAARLLQKLLILECSSSIWESAAVGSQGPNFLNAALLLTTGLSSCQLKYGVLRPTESKLGRVRGADKNAPRTMDIDIIIYDGEILDPALWELAHVAVPVAEILPDLRCEGGASLKDGASRLMKGTHLLLRSDLSHYPFATDFKTKMSGGRDDSL